MRLKAVIVESLGWEDLRRLAESLAVEGADRRSADSMRAAVGACRRATAESLLGGLGKDSLKAVCAAVGVRAAGRREEMIERILSGNGQPQTALVKKRDGMMSEETAKPEPSARLTAPQREARGMGNANGGKLDVSRLENWLWEAACVIRGPVDAPKFKDYILPLVFLKRLSDVFEDEVRHLAAEFGSEATAAKLVEKDHKLVRFFIPETARWPTIARQTTGIGQFLTDAVRAVARANPKLSGVVDVTDFNANKLFSKGRPKNFLEDQHIDRIAGAYQAWKAEEGLAAVISKAEAVKNDYNLSPSRYVATGAKEEVLPLDEAVVLLAEAEEERAEADRELDKVLAKLGFADWRGGGDNGAKR
jgi:hypothetical protein